MGRTSFQRRLVASNIIAYHTTGIGPAGITLLSFSFGNAFLTNSIHDNASTGGIIFGFPALNVSTAPPVLTQRPINLSTRPAPAATAVS